MLTGATEGNLALTHVILLYPETICLLCTHRTFLAMCIQTRYISIQIEIPIVWEQWNITFKKQETPSGRLRGRSLHQTWENKRKCAVPQEKNNYYLYGWVPFSQLPTSRKYTSPQPFLAILWIKIPHKSDRKSMRRVACFLVNNIYICDSYWIDVSAHLKENNSKTQHRHQV